MSRIAVAAGQPQTVSASSDDRKRIVGQSGSVLYSNPSTSGTLVAGDDVVVEDNTVLSIASGRGYVFVADVPGVLDSTGTRDDGVFRGRLPLNAVDYIPSYLVPSEVLDGTVDVSAYLQDAIDAGEQLDRPVLVPWGSWGIGTTVTLPDGCVLYSPRRSATLKALSTLSDSSPVLSNEDVLNGNDGISVEGLVVDANKSARGSSVAAAVRVIVSVSSGGTGTCSDVAITGNEVKNSNYIGVQLARVQRFKVEGNYVHDCERDGIMHVYDCQDGDVRGNLVVDCDDDAISFNSENVVLSNGVGDISSGNNVVSLDSGSTASVQIGDSCKVAGAGTAGADLVSIITGKSSSSITLTDNAATTVSDAAVTVGTVGHTMARINVIGNVCKGGTAGGHIACYGLKDSTVQGNASYQGHFYGIVVSNWNTTTPNRLVIQGNVISGAGVNNSGDGNGILIRSSRSTSSAGGYGDCKDIKILGNVIDDARYNGIRVLGDSTTSTMVRKLTIQGNTIKNSGATGSKQSGVVCDEVEDLDLIGNTSFDDQGTKTQSVGFTLSNIDGILRVIGNDGNGNDTAGAAGRIAISSIAGVTKIAVANNPGFDPWASTTSQGSTWSSTTVNGTTVYYKDTAVSFAVPFPAAPIMSVTAPHTGINASPVSVAADGFTMRLHATFDPGSGTHVGHWRATPSA